MGWLKQLAQERGHKSLRALAISMHESEAWPADDERKVETVANRLGDLDKRKDTTWWTSTGKAFIPALAEALQEDVEELTQRIVHLPSSAASESAALWPFRMFPDLRHLDLRSEAPFPGVPAEVVTVGGPRADRTWWVAPSGAGKTLVGRWLEVQYGWKFVQADRWTDVHFPDQGRMFLELAFAGGCSAESLARIPTELKLCVATPSRPPSQREGNRPDEALLPPVGSSSARTARWDTQPHELRGPSLLVVHTPPPQDWVFAVVDWVAARAKPGGGFEATRVRELLRKKDLLSLFSSPGDLLGFLGMVDVVGVDRLEDAWGKHAGPLWPARVWLEAALGRADRRCPTGVADLLEKRGPEILVQMEAERLRRGLESSLPEKVWADLVPAEKAPEVDRDRVVELLKAGDTDGALSMLKPDGRSVVSGLRAVGALARADGERLMLQPAWVSAAVFQAAVDLLFEEGSEGVGALLLYEDTSEIALWRLIQEVQNGQVERVKVCVGSRPTSPEGMAAVDGAFRAIGLALAAGTEVPVDVVKAAWNLQMSCVAVRFSTWPPVPLLMVASSPGRHGVTATGAWFAAALAVSRTLVDVGIELDPSPLNPWNGLPGNEGEREACVEALTNVVSAFRVDEDIAEDEPLRLALFRLGGDLLDRHGVIRRQRSLLDIQAPDLVVMLSQNADVDVEAQERQQLLRLPFGLAALEDACRRRGIGLDEVLVWCWSTWGTENGHWPPMAWLPRAGSGVSLEQVERLWRAAPAGALSDELCRHLGNRPEVWPWLPEDAWARWLDVWADREGRWSDGADAFRFMPEDLALQAVRDGRVDPWCHDVRRVLWDRMPESLLQLVDDLATVPPQPHPRLPNSGGPISDLVYAAPDECCPSLVKRARRWSEAPSEFPGVGAWLHRWLMRVVDQRSSGWRDAYELLLETYGAP